MTLLAGLLLLAVSCCLDLLPSADAAALSSRARTAAAWLIAAAASVVFVVAGAHGLAGHAGVVAVGSSRMGGLGPAALRVDPLSGLFLVVAFAVAAVVMIAGVTWAPRRARHHGLVAAIDLTLAAVAVIVTADNAFVLLFAWETLTVAFYLLTGFHRGLPGRARASVVTIGFGKVSGAALLVGLLLLASETHSFTLARFAAAPAGAPRDVAYALLLLGFAVKVGMVPVQIWLPPSYAAAPGPARAVMAGVAVNVGFYGMWRTLAILGAPPSWLAVTVLLLAGATAILGIAHATVHADLAYLVAWSSVENAGLITAGFGLSLVGAAVGNPRLVAVGILAATLQLVTHAVAKALLFLATSSVESATGTTELDALRGVARRMPWTGAGLVVGALTMAGLPLTAGFTSEWFTLEALMQQFRIGGLAMQLATAAAAALVSLTVGFAGVTFVRLVALTVFGPGSLPSADDQQDQPAGEAAWPARLGITVLAFACLALAALAPLEVAVLARGLSPVVPEAVSRGALKSPWVLQPVFSDFSILSPSWMWIVLPALLAVAVAVAALCSRGTLTRVRRVPAWTSASAGAHGSAHYTSFAYANPTRKVLANLLLTRSELAEIEERSGGTGETRDSGPGDPRLGYTSDVVEVVETYLYAPLLRVGSRLVRVAKLLQNGRLDAYMAYMLIALVAVLALVAATS